MQIARRTKHFEFEYNETAEGIYVAFAVLDADESDLARNPYSGMMGYSNGAELIDKNLAVDFLNPSYYDGRPLDLSDELRRLEKADTEFKINDALIAIYWGISELIDDYM